MLPLALRREGFLDIAKRNDRWSMDFRGDQLADGRKIRILNVVDAHTRECLAIEVDSS
jgi:putative transposase